MFWQAVAGGYRLRIRLNPKSSRDALGAPEALSNGTEVLRAYVRAVPAEGKANAALIKLLSAALGVPKSALELEAGTTSRLKSVFVRSDTDLAPRFMQLARD